MNRKFITLTVGLLGFLFLSSIFLGIYQPWKTNNIEINFSHDKIISYPGQTTWLLAEINMNYHCSDILDGISIQTNQSINFDYDIWLNHENSYIVEIFLHPVAIHLDSNILVTLSITCQNIKIQKSVIVSVIDWSYNLPFEVEQALNRFTDYLIANNTDFSQAENSNLEFLGNIPQILIVEHYLFRTDNWELELAKHVMIMPYDWVSLYIRPRNSFHPTWSGKIYSWGSNNHTIYELNPPENVYR
ncbi:MAG TPA: hypothetical protein VMZ29_16325 [Candidatus Bathyarchaeia archaeon]|nr:hypothetical protein [Candidatus Bathyarchaeia archaeon]